MFPYLLKRCSSVCCVTDTDSVDNGPHLYMLTWKQVSLNSVLSMSTQKSYCAQWRMLPVWMGLQPHSFCCTIHDSCFPVSTNDHLSRSDTGWGPRLKNQLERNWHRSTTMWSHPVFSCLQQSVNIICLTSEQTTTYRQSHECCQNPDCMTDSVIRSHHDVSSSAAADTKEAITTFLFGSAAGNFANSLNLDIKIQFQNTKLLWTSFSAPLPFCVSDIAHFLNGSGNRG